MALAIGLLSARFGYVLLNFSDYLQSPQILFSLRPAMLSPVIGLTAASVVLIYLLWRQGSTLGQIANALACGIAPGLALLALGSFLVGDQFGMPATWPWTTTPSTPQRHPVQLYEMVLLLGLSAWLWRTQSVAYPGATFWRFVLGYSLIQLFIDTFRGNPNLWGGGFRTVQVVALATALLAAYVLSFFADRQDFGQPNRDHGFKERQSET